MGDTFDGNKVNFCDTNCTREWKNTDFDDGYADIAPVGSYPSGRSFYGADDMAGNVFEWVSSPHLSYPYSTTNEREVLSPNEVIRGGAFVSDFLDLRTSYRGNSSESGWVGTGIRCVRDAE